MEGEGEAKPLLLTCQNGYHCSSTKSNLNQHEFVLPTALKRIKGVISVQNELHQGYDVFTITKRFWCNKNGSHKKNKVYYITP